MKNLRQKARIARLNALKHLAAQQSTKPNGPFRPILHELVRISRDSRLAVISARYARQRNINTRRSGQAGPMSLLSKVTYIRK